jgi:hypothetical protein
MTEKEEKNEGRRRYPSLTWPIILITAGVLFLLSNLDVLDIDFWNLWRLWPVLLILAGLEIILGRRSALGNIIVLLVTIAVIAGVVILLIAAPDVLGTRSTGGVERIDEPLAGVERGDLQVSFAAGTLEIGRLTDSSSLITGDLELATERKPVWDIRRSGGQASMTLEYRRGDWMQNWRRGDEWDLRLSPKVGLSLDVNVGAGEANLDLSGLDIRNLTVESGAGRSTIILPEEGDFEARVSGGVGQVVIEIPEGMAARVHVSRGLGDVSVPSRFDKDGDTYETDDWRSSGNRVDLEVRVGVGQVTIR